MAETLRDEYEKAKAEGRTEVPFEEYAEFRKERPFSCTREDFEDGSFLYVTDGDFSILPPKES